MDIKASLNGELCPEDCNDRPASEDFFDGEKEPLCLENSTISSPLSRLDGLFIAAAENFEALGLFRAEIPLSYLSCSNSISFYSYANLATFMYYSKMSILASSSSFNRRFYS